MLKRIVSRTKMNLLLEILEQLEYFTLDRKEW